MSEISRIKEVETALFRSGSRVVKLEKSRDFWMQQAEQQKKVIRGLERDLQTAKSISRDVPVERIRDEVLIQGLARRLEAKMHKGKR